MYCAVALTLSDYTRDARLLLKVSIIFRHAEQREVLPCCSSSLRNDETIVAHRAGKRVDTAPLTADDHVLVEITSCKGVPLRGDSVGESAVLRANTTVRCG